MSEPSKQKPLGAAARKGAAWAFLRESGAELLSFPSSMVMARLLSPEEFGIAAAAGFFTLLAGQLSGLGLNAALVRLKDLKPQHSSSVFVVNLIVGAFTCGALLLTAPWVARFYDVPETATVVSVAALAFLVSPLGTVPAAMLNRELRFREGAIAEWNNVIVFSGLSMLLAWLGFSYMSMVYGKLGGLVALVVTRLYYSPWTPSLRFSWPALKEILSFGVGVYAKRLLDYSAKNLDNLVVGKVYGMASLGLYDKAFTTVGRLLSRLTGGGPSITFRVFALLGDDNERFVRAYRKVILSTALLAFPALALLAAAAERFIVVLFGTNWVAATPALQLLCLSAALKLLNTYASSAVQASGRIWSEVWRQALSVALVVVLIVAFRRMGVSGAAAGVLTATAISTLLMHGLLLQATAVRFKDVLLPVAPGSLVAAVVAGAALAVGRVAKEADVSWPAWAILGAQCFGGGLCAGSVVLFAPIRELRDLVADVMGDLLPKRLQQHPLMASYLKRFGRQS